MFRDVFKVTIPEASSDDPTVILDPEDYMRMNAMYQSYKMNWGNPDLAMRSSVAMMARMGYKVVTGDPTVSTSPRVQMIYDPFNKIPTQQSMTGSPQSWKDYVATKIAAARDAKLIKGTMDLTNAAISLDLRSDISRADSMVAFRVDDVQGNSIYIPERFGVSENDYKEWLKKKTQEDKIKQMEAPRFEL